MQKRKEYKVKSKIIQSLSRSSLRSGSSSFIPFLFLMPFTRLQAFSSSRGMPEISSQWLKKHCGNAFPCVLPFKSSENPQDSATGKQALMMLSAPSNSSYSIIWPLLLLRVWQIPPVTSLGAAISHMNMGSSKVGLDLSCNPWKNLLAAGITCAPLRCAGSAWTTASVMLNRVPRRASPARAPSLDAYRNADCMESLISLSPCTPLVLSTIMLGVSNDHILQVSSFSHSNKLTSFLLLSLGSSFSDISRFSIMVTRSLCSGSAVPKILFILLLVLTIS